MKRLDPVVAAYLDELVSDGFLALDQAGRVDARASCGDTPLHIALWQRNHAAAMALLEAGADVDATGEDGERPLHVAVRTGARLLVDRLLQLGADPNGSDCAQVRPLHCAVGGERVDRATVEALLAAGADADAKDGDGFSPRDLVLLFGRVDLRALFVRHDEV